MSQNWENGNAARQPVYDENTSPNLFTPVDYVGRLHNTGRRRSSAPGAGYQPGNLYGAPSAPPVAAPDYETPSYLQPQQMWQQPGSMPAQGEAGAPYSAALFSHQPTAVMPSGWEDAPFADRADDLIWQDIPVEMPVWQDEPEAEAEEPQPVYYAAADVPMRDPFTPAKQREGKPEQPVQEKTAVRRKRRPLRLDRVLELCAVVMLIICALITGRLVLDLARNEREMETFRSEYREQNGMDVYHGAAKVDLLPEGQTYVPTATPKPTLFAPTPSPTPIIPINVEGVFGGSGYDASSVQEAEVTPAPVLRTKLTSYPKNPMCNITESIREMTEENGDVIGRLLIPGVVDEMVMQRNNTYYLTHNAIGSTSESGAVFADESCSLRLPPENLLLRGQSAVPGKVFAPLWQFVSGGSQFAAENMMLKLTTLYEEESYVLFAVIVAEGSGSKSFNYASNPTFTTDDAMMQYVQSARQRSLYPFNVEIVPSDRLLTLATLGSGENSLVLIYRMVRDTENMGL